MKFELIYPKQRLKINTNTNKKKPQRNRSFKQSKNIILLCFSMQLQSSNQKDTSKTTAVDPIYLLHAESINLQSAIYDIHEDQEYFQLPQIPIQSIINF